MELWQTVCRSKLLSKATFILLLNKADLLRSKLRAGKHSASFPPFALSLTATSPGIKFSDYVIDYGRDEPNTTEAVANCESLPSRAA